MSKNRFKDNPGDRTTSPAPANNAGTATAPTPRTKRSVQVQALKDAASVLAKHCGTTFHTTYERNGYPALKRIKIDTLLICVTDLGIWSYLDVWDKTSGGKVFNVGFFSEGKTHIVQFRRGDWEDRLLAAARQCHR